MKNILDGIQDLSLMKNIFNCIRLLEMDSHEIISEFSTSPYTSYLLELNYKNLQNEYKSCIQQDGVTYKVLQSNCQLLLFAVLPIFIQDKKYILECIANITNNEKHSLQLKMLENEYQLSITDELTGIYNRRYINSALPKAISICSKNKISLSIIFIDIDFFKDVNDMYGHAAGDYLLSHFAKGLQGYIEHGGNWVARYGGDEFLMCLMDTDAKEAKSIAEQIRISNEKKTVSYRDQTLKITCSIGVYTINTVTTMHTCDTILDEVDKRLYQAKSNGRNQVK